MTSIKTAMLMALGVLCLLALGNAWIAYKKSTYLEPTLRINTLEVVNGIENMERERLEQITRRLAAISESDFESLNYLTRQFRIALALLVAALVACIGGITWLLLESGKMPGRRPAQEDTNEAT